MVSIDVTLCEILTIMRIVSAVSNRSVGFVVSEIFTEMSICVSVTVAVVVSVRVFSA